MRRLEQMLAILDDDFSAAQSVSLALRAALNRMTRQPKRRRAGFFEVKDHGDGLPPHNSRFIGRGVPRRRRSTGAKRQKDQASTAA